MDRRPGATSAGLDPATVERLQSEAGVDLRLGAASALEGVGDWNPELEAEVATRRPETYQRLQAEALRPPKMKPSAAGASRKPRPWSWQPSTASTWPR